MGDRIVVMSRAEVQQVGTPVEVYYNPANLFVARFIGSPGMNLVDGKFTGESVEMSGGNRFPVPAGWSGPLRGCLGGRAGITVGFRPEAARVTPAGALAGEVYATDMHGGYMVLHVTLSGGEIVHIRSDRQTSFALGERVRFDIDAEAVRFFDTASEKAVCREVSR
jgi:multiple sugar transport system ATP-binding protein